MKTTTDCLLSGALFLCFLLCSESATLSGYGVSSSDFLGPRRLGAVSNFSTFLLERSTGTLYLGARDAILAVNSNNLAQPPQKIIWDVPEDKRNSCVAKGKTKDDCRNYIRLLQFLGDGRIYACGTYAFDPQCAFLNMSTFSLETSEEGGVRMETGKGKCPFEPSQHYTAVMAGGVLYTAATSNFLGTLFDISRATGLEQERIRTERSINWLSDPEFVSSAFIQEDEDSNPSGEDDKIYFFFTEVAKEYDLYTKVKVPRVARVCKSDVGGMKTLQRRWTTFLKAQLVCEDRASGQRFNVLTDVFTKQHRPGDPSSTHFYGIFTSQWEKEELSAVCVYSLADISKVMDGPFKELKKTCENWINPEPVPTPRPGQCLNNDLKDAGFDSSLKLPDKVLTFMRDHPLMENSVVSAPLLVRRGITYTKLAVTLTSMGEEDKRAAVVLHLGTDRGELHRVAVVGQNATLLQEIPLFHPPQPVNNIILHKDGALVGSPSALVRQPAEGCALYSSCEVCARARGLGCAWKPKAGTCDSVGMEFGDGDFEDPLSLCSSGEGRCSPAVTELRVLEGLRVLLPCVQVSPRPCSWQHPPHRHTRQRLADLEVLASDQTVGTYRCLCEEGGREQPPCLRAEYHLTLDEPSTNTLAQAGAGRHFVVWYVVLFAVGALVGGTVAFCLVLRRSRALGMGMGVGKCVGGHDSSLSEKRHDLLPSSDTPQSPSSASLLSEAVPLTKRNGTVNGHGTGTGGGVGGHNIISGHNNPGHNGHNGPHIYCNNSTSGSSGEISRRESAGKLAAAASYNHIQQQLHNHHHNLHNLHHSPHSPPPQDGRPGPEGEEGEGLSEALSVSEMGEGLSACLEEELAGLQMFRGAPLAQCEESSI
ncbi:semaphorin-4F [Engraulis encrasicolus]|uniref:semaphorin-4F n=1 Tax=Engraulis encrasicolus TaxID=184585 RepID=UPI002FD4B270